MPRYGDRMATNTPAPPVVWHEGTDVYEEQPTMVAWVLDRGAELALRPDLASIEHTEWLIRIEYRDGQIHVENV